jgi:hypothetical protein
MQAIKPTGFVDFRDVVKKAEPAEDELEASEVALAHLVGTDGWTELRRYIDSLKSEIGNLNKVLMEKGAAFEEIGRNAVVSQLAVDLLDKITTRVEDAKESVDRRKRV